VTTFDDNQPASVATAIITLNGAVAASASRYGHPSSTQLMDQRVHLSGTHHPLSTTDH